VYVAPTLFGADAQSMVQLPLLSDLSRAPRFALYANERFGDDVKLTYRLATKGSRE
jgi:riboflavin biosynthesis pyrimidine reductase